MLDISGLIAGIFLGLSLGVPPGPVNAAIAAESVKKSYVSGIFIGLGAMTCDFCYLILTVIGVSVLLTSDAARVVVSVVGGLLLLWLAATTLRDFRRPPAEAEGRQAGSPYLKGFFLAVTNPMGLVWWATAGAAFVALFSVVGVAGFMLGLFAWISTLSLAVHFAKIKFSQAYPAIMLASGFCMLAFGAVLLYNVARSRLGI